MRNTLTIFEAFVFTIAALYGSPSLTALASPRQPIPPAKSTPAASVRFGLAQPPIKRSGAIRVATYNVENFFDGVDDPALTGANEDAAAAKPEKELLALASALRTLDADVLALQEVESETALLWLRDTYLKDLGYTHHASIDAGDDRGIEQAVLSRFPITAARNWPKLQLKGKHPAGADAPESSDIAFHRSPLRVDVRIQAGDQPYEMTLFVVHHKSGRNSAYWREAEAEGAVSLIRAAQAEQPGRNVVVLGDFNAQPADRSVQTYLSAGLIEPLASFRSGPGGPSARFVTHESGRSIDLILLSPAISPEMVPESMFVFGTPARPAGVDWRTFPEPEGYASDHYPVAFDLVPAEVPTLPASGAAKPQTDPSPAPENRPAVPVSGEGSVKECAVLVGIQATEAYP